MLSLWPLLSNSRMSNSRLGGTCTPEKQERTQRPPVVPRETLVPITSKCQTAGPPLFVYLSRRSDFFFPLI
jgi:hypothetical protein